MGPAARSAAGVRAQYPDRLAVAGEPWRCPAGSIAGLLTLLFLMCLAPRLLMAWKLEAACDDAYYYVFVANCLKRWDFVSAFDYLNINLYPAILLLLHKLGFDWITGGKLWGALVASLTIFPMFGWVRRLFDDRVATMACFLYGVHPHLIEVSVEPIREATFWFLLTTSLYFIWRSVDELKLWLFLLSGLTVALALHTRIEGWALFVPFAIWSLHRFQMLDGRQRWRLAGGSLAMVAVTPLLLVAVNTTILRGHGKWEFGRLNHLAVVGRWMRVLGFDETAQQFEVKPTPRLNKQSSAVVPGPLPPAIDIAATTPAKPASEVATTAGASTDQVSATAAAAPIGKKVAPLTESLWSFIKDLARSVGPISLIFLAIGLWRVRGTLTHRDKSTLLIVASAIIAAIWLRLVFYGNMNGRYFLILPFLLAPFHALGCLTLIEVVRELVRINGRGELRLQRVTAALLMTLMVVGWADALKSNHRERQAHIAFGKHLRQHAASANFVIADLGSTRAGYFVTNVFPAVIDPSELLDDVYDRQPPDVIVFSRDCLSHVKQPVIVQRAADLGLQVIDSAQLPPTDTEFIVMLRLPAPAKNSEQFHTAGRDSAFRR